MSVNNESMNQTTKMEIEDTNQKFSNDNVSDIKNDAINIDDNSIDIECISDDDIDLSVGISDDKKLFSPIKKEESGMVQPLKMSEEHKLFNEEDIIKVTQNCCLFYHSSTITKQTKTCAEISKIFVYNLPHFLNAGNTLETVRDFIGTAKCPFGKEIVISNALSIFFKNQQKNNTFMYNLFILLNDVKYQNGVMEIIELLLLNYPSNMALFYKYVLNRKHTLEIFMKAVNFASNHEDFKLTNLKDDLNKIYAELKKSDNLTPSNPYILLIYTLFFVYHDSNNQLPEDALDHLIAFHPFLSKLTLHLILNWKPSYLDDIESYLDLAIMYLEVFNSDEYGVEIEHDIINVFAAAQTLLDPISKEQLTSRFEWLKNHLTIA
ncbi:hypothetical protein QTN25_002851 [Entamoeba marina]